MWYVTCRDISQLGNRHEKACGASAEVVTIEGGPFTPDPRALMIGRAEFPLFHLSCCGLNLAGCSDDCFSHV